MPGKAASINQRGKKTKEESVENDNEVVEFERPDNVNENNNNQVGFVHNHDLRPGEIERHIRVDPQTRAQQVYQTDGKGSQMYGYYYNSDNDPKFQQQHNKDGRQNHTSCCYFSSVSSSSGQPQQMNVNNSFINNNSNNFTNRHHIPQQRRSNQRQGNEGPVV